MSDVDQMFVVTGGPGSGKTTLVTALAACGFSTMPEAGRAIIQQQIAIGGTALPWSNRLAFAELMLEMDIRSYRGAEELRGPVIFDRGIPDVLGYLRVSGVPVPARIEEAARKFRYHRRVFLAPPWPAIFGQDEERKQSIAEAEATCDAMVDVYSSFGYELLVLPLIPVDERIEFVRNIIG
jgi:predicted ATPase